MADFGIGETIALIAAISSTTAAVYSGVQAEKQGDAEAAAAANQARAAQDEAEAYAERTRKALKSQRASARAAAAASGIDVGAGAPVLIDREITREGEQDAYMTILTGNRNADTYRQEGELARARGNAARTASYLEGAGSLMSSGADTYGKWKKAQPAKTPAGQIA